MTDPHSPSAPQLSPAEIQEILRSLLHKEGNWIDWGNKCQLLQKAGYSSQQLFEETGFQNSQQNLIKVAAQVYATLVEKNASEELLTYFSGPRSDVLYELRILNQEQRLATAEVAYAKRLEFDEAKSLAKAVQEVSRLSQLPPDFTRQPGDAMAYLAWKKAKQQKDLQQRSRFIAQGLKFAQSSSARMAIEKLLSDFSVTPTVTAPLLPSHRFETEEQLSRIIPVAGKFPLSREALEAIPALESQEPFRMIQAPVNLSVVPIPGWQVVLKAQDPVAIFVESEELPISLSGKPEEMLLLIDRNVKDWNINQYFLVELDGKLAVKWFETEPDCPIVAQVIFVLRPKKILDENNLLEPWQMDD